MVNKVNIIIIIISNNIIL